MGGLSLGVRPTSFDRTNILVTLCRVYTCVFTSITAPSFYRRDSKRQLSRSSMPHKGLHITIGASPDSIDSSGTYRLSLENELKMVKAALLYANHAKLCSMTSSALLAGLNFTELPIHKKVDFVEAMGARLAGYFDTSSISDVIGQYRQAWRKRYSKDGRAKLKLLETHLEKVWPIVEAQTAELVHKAGGNGILQAKESGLLEIHTFDNALLKMFSQGAEHREWMMEYVGVIANSVSDASTYPLFDELMSRLIGSGIRAGFIAVSESGTIRAKEAGLAAELFKRLPLFEEASIDEILDIRKELEQPLIRFRSAMIDFSEKIKDAAWDENFSFDAEQVFNRDVAPVVLNIEDEVKANSYLRELARKWIDKPLLITGGSALALALSNLPVPSIAALAVGITANTLAAIYDTNKEWRKQQRAVEQNNMYFYYRAGKLLSE